MLIVALRLRDRSKTTWKMLIQWLSCLFFPANKTNSPLGVEFDLAVGDECIYLKRHDAHWLFVEKGGEQGYVPAAYVVVSNRTLNLVVCESVVQSSQCRAFRSLDQNDNEMRSCV